MGKGLHQQHIAFFTSKMDEHSRVVNWMLIEDQYEYIFRIRRRLHGSESDVIVHLTDAYRYGFSDFFTRPNQLRTGSFVVIGMPHADVDPAAIGEARQHCIGIGHIGKFMGALNFENIWKYMTPDERQRKEEEQRRKSSDT